MFIKHLAFLHVFVLVAVFKTDMSMNCRHTVSTERAANTAEAAVVDHYFFVTNNNNNDDRLTAFDPGQPG